MAEKASVSVRSAMARALGLPSQKSPVLHELGSAVPDRSQALVDSVDRAVLEFTANWGVL